MVAPIPPDISYGLQCSVECFDITNDVLSYYYRFNQEPLAQMVDDSNYRTDDIKESLRSLSRLYYRPYNRWFWQTADPIEQAWCVAQGVEGFGRKAAELIDHLFTQFVSHTLVNQQNPSSHQLQQQWLDTSRQMTHTEKIVAQLARKATHIDQDMLTSAMLYPAEFTERMGFPTYDYERGGYHVAKMKPGSVAQMAKARRNKMTVLKKSSSFLTKLVGSKDVSMFIGGKEIRVTGDKYTFSLIKKSVNAIDHGALGISVYDNKTQERLFDLCWYVDNTPALDQISALVLAVRAGDEDEIIKVGNAFNVKRETIVEHDHLRSALPNTILNNHLQTFDLFDTTDPPAVDDQLLHRYPGTTQYVQTHADVYLQFAAKCTRRLTKKQLPGVMANYCRPQSPHLIRNIVGNQVGRELLQEQPRLLAA